MGWLNDTPTGGGFKVTERFDMVERPPHYADRQFEVIDVMKDTMQPEHYIGYLFGCSLKYMMRWDKKGKPVEDLGKAMWYLKRLADEVGGK